MQEFLKYMLLFNLLRKTGSLQVHSVGEKNYAKVKIRAFIKQKLTLKLGIKFND